jgi:arabinose-5-phosphate isomerase
MERQENVFHIELRTVMNTSPKIAHPEELAGTVVYRMEQHGIMAMPVVEEDGTLAGVIHLHDAMRAGAA